MSQAEDLKRAAAERAVELIESDMMLGLGTGSTVRHVLDILAERLHEGDLRGIAGVATSRQTERLARELGIPLRALEQEPRLDLTIDGADEVAPGLQLIKGLGGALLWEKIVATASDRVVIVADEGKRVSRLGTRAPLPVEVVPFGWSSHLSFLELFGASPTLRLNDDGTRFLTDGNHYIIDCRFDGGIDDPEALQAALRSRPGLVETGLFLGLADQAVLAGETGVTVVGTEDAWE